MSLTSDVQIPKEPNAIMNKFMGDLSSFLESEIQSRYELLQLYKKISVMKPDDQIANQQVEAHMAELHNLIKQLIDVRKDNDFVNPATKPIVDELESIESICPDCGKKKEQVTLVGPHSKPKLDKKKRKEFHFTEAHEAWERVIGFTHSSSFVGHVVYDSETQEMLITLSGKKYVFCNVSDRLFDAFEGSSSKGSFFNREIKNLHDC